MLDLPDILGHLSHANAVQGGAMLFDQDRTPLLSLEAFVEPRRRLSGPIHAAVQVTHGRGRMRAVADSAEAVRDLKRSMGVAPRPTTKPVDEWRRN